MTKSSQAIRSKRLRAVLYERVSSEEQVDGYSL
jgi:predicted site-specific integrase-resolvase